MLINIAKMTVFGTIMTLAIGGTIAGIQSAISGHGFWQGFAEHVQENALDALITSFAIASVTVAISGIMAAAQCFIAGTLIKTDNGDKKIEEIEEGDLVLSYNEQTGKQEYKKVVRLFRNETKEWYHVLAGNEEIVCTSEHPFYIVGKGFTPAKDIIVSDKLLLSNGSYAIIQSIEIEKLEVAQTTYNFEVEDFHTYYVGKNGVLVHNACGGFKNYTSDQIAKKYDISVDQFHKQVKPEILRQVKPNYKVGSNPNILLSKTHEIAYQGVKGMGFQETGLNMFNILGKFNL